MYDSVATVKGLRHWWTTLVTGSPAPSRQLSFGFAGLDERIVMLVDAVEPQQLVRWTCIAHTRAEEWTGSSVRFHLAAQGERACELDFQHHGIAPELVTDGWDHFLTSLADYAQHGRGTPFGG